MNWINGKRIAKLICFLLINIIFVEIFSFAVGKAGLLATFDTPRIYKKLVRGDEVSYTWWNEKNTWGAWHQINRKSQHRSACFTANYKSNDIGARDSSFIYNKGSKDRFLLLGDSFAEGWGLNYKETPQYLIERLTGYEVYNFGSAGDFGPVQYWLIYKELAQSYSYDGIIIFLYPENDFRDNDYRYMKSVGLNKLQFSEKERYRPYFYEKKDSDGKDNFGYFIPENAIKRDNLVSNGSNRLINFIYENLWTGNLIKTFRSYSVKKRILDTQDLNSKSIYSGYFDSDINQQRASMHFIEKIVTNTKKPVILFSIPQVEDFNRLNKGWNRNQTYWHSYLSQLEDKENFKFVDLIDYEPKFTRNLYFDCDPHWSSEGSNWASRIIANVILELDNLNSKVNKKQKKSPARQ